MTDAMDSILRLVPPAVTLLAVVVGWTHAPGRLRSTLKSDAEILSLLPSGVAKTKLEVYISERIEQLILNDTGTRDWPMFAFAIVATLGAGYLAIWLGSLGQWWTYGLAAVAATFGLICLYGIFESAQKKDRE
ncbi:hypothetical protein [Arthrobacter rhombi]|uniref:hypothetical protein n=1 Tax=Arthrobacter rhombi TaxID=71253 RepID=UPI003FD0AD14